MKSNRGFTFIEIIVIVVIIAIAAALFVTYLGRSFTQSPVSSGRVQNQYALIRQMEVFTSQYRNQLNAGTLNLATFKTTYIDGKTYVDAANTKMNTLPYGTYTTQQFLQVTLTDGNQTLLSIFTQ
jgi:prepilin-type N-terminal cleavage/methylation domain-containing protein